jgi:hypothetical protein
MGDAMARLSTIHLEPIKQPNVGAADEVVGMFDRLSNQVFVGFLAALFVACAAMGSIIVLAIDRLYADRAAVATAAETVGIQSSSQPRDRAQ